MKLVTLVNKINGHKAVIGCVEVPENRVELGKDIQVKRVKGDVQVFKFTSVSGTSTVAILSTTLKKAA